MARAIIDRASQLTLQEIVRLDIADREHPELQLAMWDVLRSQFEIEPARTLRFMARNEAWAAVNVSLAAAGIDAAIDDGYWRVTTRVGWGAARAARFAACAAVGADTVDPDVIEALDRPWRSVVRSVGPDSAD